MTVRATDLQFTEPIFPIAETPHTIAVTSNSPSTSHSFFEPEVYESLCAKGILINNVLTNDCSLPPSSTAQIKTLVSLLEESFDMVDHSGEVILKDLNPRELINYVLKSSRVHEKVQLAGSSVYKVIESDPDWVKTALSPILKEKYDALLPHPKREPKDLDIHVICKKDSGRARSDLIKLLLQELGRRVALHNRSYIESEISKILAIPENQQDKSLHSIFSEIRTYQEILSQENSSKELIELSFNTIAKSIVQRNCLKKFSDNAFGTMISFGRFEFILSEKTDYLLTPDKMVIIFDPEIKHSATEGTHLFPSDRKGVEALLHRKLKIACIDLAPTEYTFQKACGYIAFGNHVPVDEKFNEAYLKYLTSIDANGTTKNGFEVFKRFGRNHLKESPEEALCILLTMFRFLNSQKNDAIIPIIIGTLKEYLSKPLKNSLLEAIRRLLITSPNEYSLLSTCLQVISSAQTKLHESWIAFSNVEGFEPHVLRQELDPLAFDKIKMHQKKQLVSHFLSTLLEADSGEIEGNFEVILSWIELPHLRNVAYFLLLKCKDIPMVQLLHFFPEVYLSLPEIQRERFIKTVEQRITDQNILKTIAEFQNNPDVRSWMLSIAKSHADYAYTIWTKYGERENLIFASQLAEAMYPYGVAYAFKVIQGTLLEETNEQTTTLSEVTHNTLCSLLDSNSPLLERDLTNVLPDVAVWLVNSFLAQNRPDRARLVIDKCKERFPIISLLTGSRQNFWTILTDAEAIGFCDELSHQSNLEVLSEGLNHLQRKPLNLDDTLKILGTFSNIKTQLSDAKPPLVLYLIHQYLHFLQSGANWSDQKARIPLLFDITSACGELYKNSISYIYFQSYQSLLALLIEIPFQQLIDCKIDSENLSTIALRVLNDKSQPVQNCLSPFTTFLNSLVELLKKEKQDEWIYKIVKALDSSSLSLSECPIIGEYRYQQQLQMMDARALSNNDIDRHLKSLKEKKENERSKELINFCGRLLFENQFTKLKMFLAGVIAYNYQSYLPEINKRILDKLKTLKKVDSYIELLDIILEYKLIQSNKKEYLEKTSAFLKSLTGKEIQTNWLFLFKLIDYLPDLKKQLLPLLFTNLTLKNFAHIENYWLLEIESESYGGLEGLEASKCSYIFISFVLSSKSKKVIYLVSCLDKFEKLFKSFLTVKEITELLQKWIRSCLELLQDPDKAREDDNNAIEKLLSYFISFKEEMSHETLRAVFWNITKYKIYSRNLIYNFQPLPLLKELQFTEKEFENVKEVIVLTLEKLNQVTTQVFPTESAKYIFHLSNQCRNAVGSTSLESFLAKNIPPYSWMKGLVCIKSQEAVLEAFEWFKLFLKSVPLPKVKNAPIQLSKECTIIVKYILNSFINDPSVHSQVILKELINSLSALGKRNSDFAVCWEGYVDLILDNFYREPLSQSCFNSNHIRYAWKKCIKFAPIIKNQIDADLFIPSLIQLIESGQIVLATHLWNEILLSTVSVKGLKPTETVKEELKDGKCFYKESPFSKELKFLKTPERLDKRKIDTYVTTLFKMISLCSEGVRNEHHWFLCELAANCINELFDLYEKVPNPNRPIQTVFLLFFYMLHPKNGHDFSTHIKDVCPKLFGRLSRMLPSYMDTTAYYEHYVRLLCPNSETSPSITCVSINKHEIKKVVDGILETVHPDANKVLDLAYLVALLRSVIKNGIFLDLDQLMLYHKHIFDFLKKADNLEMVELDYKFTVKAFFLLDEIRETIHAKFNAAIHPQKAYRDYYSYMRNEYIKFLHDPKWSENQRKYFLLNGIDWLKELKCTFDDFSVEYEALLEEYLLAFEKLTSVPTMVEIKVMNDKFMLWVIDFPFALSPEGSERRAKFINRWLHSFNITTLQSQFIIKITNNFCKTHKIFEGFNELQNEVKALLDKINNQTKK